MITGQLDKNQHCPSCHRLLDGFTSINNDKHPQPDDVTMCAYCDTILQFTDGLGLKIASQEAAEAHQKSMMELFDTMSYKKIFPNGIKSD